MDDNNNFYGQDNSNNPNNDQGQFGQAYQQGQTYQQQEGQPYQGQPYQQQQYQQQQYQQPYQGQPYQQQQYQQQYQQQPYQQSAYQSGGNNLDEPVSFGDWMLTILVMCIPCVNIIMMFVWAFSSNTKKSKSNYFKAALVWALISIVVSIVLVAVFGVSLAAFSDYYY